MACLPQVMLKQDSGEYACIAEDRARYNLGDVKEEMQAAMGLNTEVRWEGRCCVGDWQYFYGALQMILPLFVLSGGGECHAVPQTRQQDQHMVGR